MNLSRLKVDIGLVWRITGWFLLSEVIPIGEALNNIHLMYGPEENGNSCIPSSPYVSRGDEVSGNIRTRGKTKLTSFPRDRTLSALLFI